MITINVKAVLAAEKEREGKPKPLPKVDFGNKPKTTPSHPPSPLPNGEGPEVKPPALTDLEHTYARILKERKILSTQTHRLVAEVASKLAMESPGLAKEFVEGRMGMPEIKDHYARIQDKSDQLLALFDQISHVKRYGTMPVHTPPPMSLVKIFDSPEAALLRHEIRRLDDMIFKTTKKLAAVNSGLRAPRNSDRVNDWRIKIALAEARRSDCKTKLKRMQYEQRVGKS